MLALPDVLHFFVHKLARLGGWRLSLTRITARPLDGFLFRHTGVIAALALPGLGSGPDSLDSNGA